ncbi:choline/ethanolamine kinase family protein [Candidatus Formimonas warabiya]|uniref:Phosphotransferase family protein n=1 Tax=Formimonas warabiya TaxID=1761012 RepID=A0A3G1KQ92_FORW1|nr:choline/ethanolamine kinase family protein [Candidatus Formimonas warabiya]ATW24606.1 hypothetical protein DCMF_07240 [Candidatus Formimonas warabiya]
METKQILVDDSISLEHRAMIFGIMSKVPLFAGQDIERIEVLGGGLTNSNYKVTLGGVPYAVRVYGEGTSEYIDRKAEKYNAQLMSDIGVNARIFYFDEDSGSAVCEFLDHSKTFHADDFRDHESLRQAARILQKVHRSGQRFINRFDPCQVTDQYARILHKKDFPLYEEFPPLDAKKNQIQRALEKSTRPLVPSHNDTLAENFLLNEAGLFLIDWEYSGMNDPMYDLGDFATENELSVEEEMVFLREYFGGEVSPEQYGELVINKFLVDLFWATWSLLQIANGKEREYYWDYGMTRINRCLRYMGMEDFDRYIEGIASAADGQKLSGGAIG